LGEAGIPAKREEGKICSIQKEMPEPFPHSREKEHRKRKKKKTEGVV